MGPHICLAPGPDPAAPPQSPEQAPGRSADEAGPRGSTAPRLITSRVVGHRPIQRHADHFLPICQVGLGLSAPGGGQVQGCEAHFSGEPPVGQRDSGPSCRLPQGWQGRMHGGTWLFLALPSSACWHWSCHRTCLALSTAPFLEGVSPTVSLHSELQLLEPS